MLGGAKWWEAVQLANRSHVDATLEMTPLGDSMAMGYHTWTFHEHACVGDNAVKMIFSACDNTQVPVQYSLHIVCTVKNGFLAVHKLIRRVCAVEVSFLAYSAHATMHSEHCY